MELNEALLFVGGIVLMVLGAIIIERYFGPKSRMIVSLLAMLLLMGMFTYTLIENFSYRRLLTTSLLLFLCIYSFYRRYKKYKKEIQQPNYSSE
jgi:Ca2+/Na+ antiporter